MKLIRSSGTGLEDEFESLLRKSGIAFEKQPNLPGHPDFRIKDANLVIFCDSSFWHGRRKSELDGTAFSKNRAFWTSKLAYNRLRDVRTNRRLRKEGWRVIRFWDDDVLKNPEKVSRKLLKAIKEDGRK